MIQISQTYIAPPEALVVDSPELVRRQVVPMGREALVSLAIMAVMVVLLATGLVPAAAGILAAGAILLFGILDVEEIYRAINWTTVILVGAMMPLSTAITETGAAKLLAEGLIGLVGGFGPRALLAGLRQGERLGLTRDAIDLDIKEGEFFTLLGPSGCGKTTTLRMIAGFEEPNEGQILVGGTDVAGLPAHKRPTNTVFQSYALFPHLTVRENVAYGLKRKKVDKSEIGERVDAELERVGLANEANRKPNQLSGGQQQRVSIARALMNGGRVILADEPTGALDSQSGSDVMALLRDMNNQGHTVIVITHSREVAEQADRLIEIHDGRIVANRAKKSRSNAEGAAALARHVAMGHVSTCLVDAVNRAIEQHADQLVRIGVLDATADAVLLIDRAGVAHVSVAHEAPRNQLVLV